MKSTIKKLKNCKRVLEIEESKEVVQEKFNEVYKELGKTASVAGFRIGKVPRNLLEQHFGSRAKEGVLKRLIPELYKEALNQYKLDPISLPEISDVHLEGESPLHFKAELEIRPEFEIKNYKGLKIKKKNMQLKEEDVTRALESLRESNAQLVPKGDSGQKQKVLPPLDDEFAKDLGFSSLIELKKAVEASLEQKFKREIEADLELQIIDQLVRMNPFEAPESLVTEERERILKDAKARIKYLESIQKEKENKSFELSQKDLEELEENAGRQALKKIRVFFLLDKIAQKENIHLTQEELDKRVEEIAKASGKDIEEVNIYLRERHILDEMVLNMRNQKVMEFLLKEAEIREQ